MSTVFAVTSIEAVKSPSSTSVAVTPASGSNVSNTAIDAFPTPAKTGGRSSSPHAASSTVANNNMNNPNNFLEIFIICCSPFLIIC